MWRRKQRPRRVVPKSSNGAEHQLESSPIQYAPVVTSGQREPRSTSVHSTPSANDKKITPTVVLPIIPPRTRQRSTDSATSAGKMKQGRISSGSKPRHVSAHTSVDSDGGSESIKSVSKLRVVHGDEVLADTVHDAFEVIVFGSINMDMIAATSTYPRNGTTMAASHFQTKPGGKGANEAVAVARLGVPTVLVGRIGKDLFGDQLLKSLKSENVHCTGISVVEGSQGDSTVSTGISMITIAEDKSGKNTIACLGANLACGRREVLAIDKFLQYRPQIGILLIQNEVNASAITRSAKLARLAKKLVVYKASPIFRPDDVPSGLCEMLDVLVVNEFEAPIMLGWQESGPFPLQNLRDCRRAAFELKRLKGVPVVIILTPFGHTCHAERDATEIWLSRMEALALRKRRASRSSGDMSEEESHVTAKPHVQKWRRKLSAVTGEDHTVYSSFVIPPLQVKAVDIIGAADAAVGGLTAALALKLPLEYAMVWAACCGALSLLSSGAQDSMVKRSQLRSFMNERQINVDPEAVSSPSDLWPSTPDDDHVRAAPILAALSDGSYDELVIYLREMALDPMLYASTVDFQGLTLLHVAVIFHDLHAVCLILRYDGYACTTMKDRYGLTPVDRAYECWMNMRDAVQSERLRVIVVVLISAHLFRAAFANEAPHSAGLYSISRLAVTAKHHPDLQHAIVSRNVERLLLWLLLGDDDMKREKRTSGKVSSMRTLGIHLCECMLDRATTTKEALGFKKATVESTGVGFFHAFACVGSLRLLVHVKRLKLWARTDPCTDAAGKTPLFFAVASEDLSVCKFLVEWGFELWTVDKSNKTAVAYCKSAEFSNQLLDVGKYRDVFISYGHHPETNDFTHQLAKDLRQDKISSWIDTDIEQGSRWRESIQDAIKYSGGMLIILSRKWVDSNYCRGEAALALNLNKPIYVLVPPLSATELVGRAALPISMKKTLSERQFFTFADAATYDESMRGLVDALKQISPMALGRLTGASASMDVRRSTGDEPLVFSPPSAAASTRRASLTSVVSELEDYIFLCCGSSLFEGHFCEALKNAMVSEGITVVVGAAGHHYPQLRQCIINARVFVFVLAERDDQVFLQRMLLEAVELKRPIVSVPYMVAPHSEGGFGYTAASTVDLRTVCFTDWVGHGLHEHSSVFREIFPRLIQEIDDLAERKKPCLAVLPALDDVPNLVLHPVNELRSSSSVGSLSPRRNGLERNGSLGSLGASPASSRWQRSWRKITRGKGAEDVEEAEAEAVHVTSIPQALRQMDLANYMKQIPQSARRTLRVPPIQRSSTEAPPPQPTAPREKRRGKRDNKRDARTRRGDSNHSEPPSLNPILSGSTDANPPRGRRKTERRKDRPRKDERRKGRHTDKDGDRRHRDRDRHDSVTLPPD